jgi:hypothetical protein
MFKRGCGPPFLAICTGLYWTPILGSPNLRAVASLPASRSYKTWRATTLLLIAACRRVPLPRQLELAVAGACICIQGNNNFNNFKESPACFCVLNPPCPPRGTCACACACAWSGAVLQPTPNIAARVTCNVANSELREPGARREGEGEGGGRRFFFVAFCRSEIAEQGARRAIVLRPVVSSAFVPCALCRPVQAAFVKFSSAVRERERQTSEYRRPQTAGTNGN